jgi:hypothetical protein
MRDEVEEFIVISYGGRCSRTTDGKPEPAREIKLPPGIKWRECNVSHLWYHPSPRHIMILDVKLQAHGDAVCFIPSLLRYPTLLS